MPRSPQPGNGSLTTSGGRLSHSLPVPRDGLAEFNPVLFNYQSREGDPAVLAILATREGTSVTVIDNQRDGFEAGQTWGQRLFFNQNGERASLTGQRKSDFATGTTGEDADQSAAESNAQPAEGLNMVLLIQVPLKQKERPRERGMHHSATGSRVWVTYWAVKPIPCCFLW